jgi:hypothetical protein
VASSDGALRFDASAWTASTQWAIAVLLCLVAGTGWLIARSLGRFETAAGLLARVAAGFAHVLRDPP